MNPFSVGDRVRFINNDGSMFPVALGTEGVVTSVDAARGMVYARFKDHCAELMYTWRLEATEPPSFRVFGGPLQIYLGVAEGETAEEAFRNFQPLPNEEYTLIPVNPDLYTTKMSRLRLKITASEIEHL